VVPSSVQSFPTENLAEESQILVDAQMSAFSVWLPLIVLQLVVATQQQ
jgi:hypothetical protein